MVQQSSSRRLTEPLEQGSVVNLVVERIKEALLNKELKPGDYLPSSQELARNLGVGISSIREAVKMLQAIGIVEIRRGQGTVIREHPGHDMFNPLVFQLILENGRKEDILNFRKMFETAYSLMAMERADEQDFSNIRDTLDEFEMAIRRGDPRADDDLAFHQAVLNSTHNPFVIKIGETVHQLFRASIRKSMRTIPETALRDHRAIFDAFSRKNSKDLEEAILHSFEGWKISLNSMDME